MCSLGECAMETLFFDTEERVVKNAEAFRILYTKNDEKEKLKSLCGPFRSIFRLWSDFEGLLIGLRGPRGRTTSGSKPMFYSSFESVSSTAE